MGGDPDNNWYEKDRARKAKDFGGAYEKKLPHPHVDENPKDEAEKKPENPEFPEGTPKPTKDAEDYLIPLGKYLEIPFSF